MRSNHDSDRPARPSTETDFNSGLLASRRDLPIPALSVLYHPDLERIGERVALLGLMEGGEALVSRREPVFSAPSGGGLRRPLGHKSLSRQPIRLHRAIGETPLCLDATSTRTSVEADGEPVQCLRHLSTDELERGVVLRLGPHVVVLLHLFDPLGSPSLSQHGLIGENDGIRRVRREISKVADLDVPVLARGETGTGKELVARAIHDASRRRDRPFVAVNMAALPSALAAAELFGSLRGAFTGAEKQRRGLFAHADGGTLFLDEVGEMPGEVQAMLLRALETGEVRPVGSEESYRVDVRLISATDANLEGAIASGSFRAPLLHRLAGFELHLPPLRDRRDDLGRLLHHFLCQELSALGEDRRLEESSPWLPAEDVARLASYDWPGNVRQLANFVRQIVITSRGEELARLPEALLAQLDAKQPSMEPSKNTVPTTVSSSGATRQTPRRKPSELDDDTLLELLRTHRFNLRAAAADAGISPTSLYTLIEKSPRLRKPAELDDDEIDAALAQAGGDVDLAAFDLEVSSLGLKRRIKELGLS